MDKKEIENLIYSYHWMKKEVDRLEKILWGFTIPINTKLIGKYGIEATLPKGSPLKSKEELEAMDLREERLYNRWKKFRGRVIAVEMIAESIQDDKLLVILDCMMEGMSYRAIAAHLRVSRSQIRKMKETGTKKVIPV